MSVETSGSVDVPVNVAACYGRNARQKWHQRRRHRAVLDLLRHIEGEVLDYGCGYGDVTHAISRTHSVRGVDVDAARVSFASREYPRLSFSTCEPGHVPFPGESFDIVTSIAVIHFVADPRQYLREARRVLRPHGWLLIACINEPVVRNGIRRLLGRQPLMSRIWTRPREDFRQLLLDEGFAVERESYFYDPPFEGWKNIGDVLFGAIQQMLSLIRLRYTANYYLFLARKT